MSIPQYLFVLIQVTVMLLARVCFAEVPQIDCKCEVISCKPCESEIDIKFYSEKCGENLSRMKSCKKPVCEAVPDQAQCLADLGLTPKKIVEENRMPASEEDRGPIGLIETSIGSSIIYRDGKPDTKVADGLSVFENDRVVTSKDSKVKIIFSKTKEEFHILPESNVFIQSFQHKNEQEIKNTIIKLDLGSIRIRTSKNEEKYDGKRNIFEIKTRTAVAGIRGTDFVMHYDDASKVSLLETIAGAVELFAQNAGDKGNENVLVSAGESCSTLVESDFSHLGKIQKIEAKKLLDLDQTTEVKEVQISKAETKSIAKTSVICEAPSADYNDCAFFCEGNPKDQKSCRTDLAGVSCVRKTCGANGQWILPTRMPSSQSGECKSSAPVKASCGTYW